MSDVNPFSAPMDQGGAYASEFDDEEILADRGTRFVARLIDGGLFLGAFLPGYVMVLMAEGNRDIGPVLALVGLVVLAVGTIGLIGYQWFLLSTQGQTLGKKWMSVRIVKVDGSRVDFLSAVILRNWVLSFINAFVGILGLIDALMIFSNDRRCLHDHIAGTKVVVAMPDLDDDLLY